MSQSRSSLDQSTPRFLAACRAAAVALAVTWVVGWGFVDSTRVARWVSPAAVAVAQVAHAASGAGAVAGSLPAKVVL